MTTIIDMEECCSICIHTCEKNNIVTPCNHIFHKECFHKWEKHSLLTSGVVRCPNCNYTIGQEQRSSIEVSPVYFDHEMMISLCVNSCCYMTFLFIIGTTVFLAIEVSKLS